MLETNSGSELLRTVRLVEAGATPPPGAVVWGGGGSAAAAADSGADGGKGSGRAAADDNDGGDGASPTSSKMRLSRVALNPSAMSNCVEDDVGAAFLEEAAAATEARRARGFDAAGRLGGQFSESNPPPGKVFGGYHKGCTGVNWEDAPVPGFCEHCGQSLFHYAGKACGAAGKPPHPAWVHQPPPSFADVNG